MEFDFRPNAMTEILMIMMDAVVNALLKLVGLVKVVLLPVKANAINLFPIKQSYLAREQLI